MTVAYRGTRYYGWQRQLPAATWKGPAPEPGHGIPTIQETLARAIAGVVGHPINLVGSSRTDSGVHALGQVAHFDTDRDDIPADGLRRAVNHQLPDDIVIQTLEPAPTGFHAITSTLCKRYEYAIHSAPNRDPLAADMAWHRWQPLDVDAMVAAAGYLVGEHDFSSFAKPGHRRFNTVRNVTCCEVNQVGPRVTIGVEGEGFLWNMVRIIAGTLMEVGLGHRPAAEMPAILGANDRRAAGGTAPPHGLYLMWIQMAEDANLDWTQEGVAHLESDPVDSD